MMCETRHTGANRRHRQDLKTMFDLTINSVTDLVEQQLNLLWSEGLQNGVSLMVTM